MPVADFGKVTGNVSGECMYCTKDGQYLSNVLVKFALFNESKRCLLGKKRNGFLIEEAVSY